MKRRTGFVSNSSSSSFIIGNSKLTLGQIDDIVRHSVVAKERMPEIEWPDDYWSIEVSFDYVKGSTMMDNFDMYKFLENIGVAEDDIEWEHS